MKKLIPLLLMAPLLTLFAIQANSAPQPLFIGVACDKTTYKSGDTIAIALTLLNTGNTSTEVNFTSGKKYDFYLYEGTKIIWKWSQDKMFTQELSNLTLTPQKPLTYVIKFNQVLLSGTTMAPGQYQLRGVLCTHDKEFLSDLLTFEIRK